MIGRLEERILPRIEITHLWIGLEQVEGTGTDPSEFLFVDGETEGLDFIHVEVGTFPWRVNEPNNFEGKEENCGCFISEVFKLPITHSFVTEIALDGL